MIRITDCIRGYATDADRNRAIAQLRRFFSMNYFVCFRDVQAPFALEYGKAAWVPPGTVHVNR